MRTFARRQHENGRKALSYSRTEKLSVDVPEAGFSAYRRGYFGAVETISKKLMGPQVDAIEKGQRSHYPGECQSLHWQSQPINYSRQHL